MPKSAMCRMVVKSATKPRFGKQNVMMSVVDAEETGIQKGVFTFKVFDGGDGSSFFDRGDEFDLEFSLAAEAEEEPKPDDEEEVEEAEAEEEVEEAEIPPPPDVTISELKNALAGVDDIATLEAWQAADDRATAEPIYEARIHELQEENGDTG